MKNLLEIYEGALENAKQNNVEFTKQYVSDYAENAYETPKFLTDEQLDLIISCHNNYSKLENKNSNEYFHAIEKPLAAN